MNKTRDVEFLLKKGHDVNEKLDNGRTALFIAIELNHTAMIALLIHKGADVNVKDDKGLTPLHIACYHRHVDTGADVNFKSATGYTSLHMACRCHTNDVIAKKLLRHGAYYNLRDDKKDKTPRRHAREGGRNHLDKLLQLIDMVYRDVTRKHEEIVSNLKYLQTNYKELFDLLKFVRNSKGDSLVSLAKRGKEKNEILREVNDLLTEGTK
ncbi:hypothetical protein WDU94_015338 [Cyamophila willieti]